MNERYPEDTFLKRADLLQQASRSYFYVNSGKFYVVTSGMISNSVLVGSTHLFSYNCKRRQGLRPIVKKGKIEQKSYTTIVYRLLVQQNSYLIVLNSPYLLDMKTIGKLLVAARIYM